MLKINRLSKTFYPGTEEENQVFNEFSLDIRGEECTAILGPNGCGKSTLFNLISGKIQEDQGSIQLENVNLSDLNEENRARYIGKVMQDPSKGVSPNLTVLENMTIARKKGQKFTLKSLLKNQDKEVVIEELKTLNLGLENKLNTKVKYLSGGQRQSLSLLMATLVKPDLLLLDEHTAALDPKTSQVIMEKTVELIEREKMMTLMITHSLRNAVQFADRVIMLNHGQLMFDLKTQGLTEIELEELYYETINQSLKSA